MQGSIDGGGEHFEGYFLCNENGEVFNISSDSSQYKFLMADDSYEPDFTEYIGKSIAEAMEDENPVYEQIAGGSSIFSFSIVETSLNDVEQFNISGVIIPPIKICPALGTNVAFVYINRIIVSPAQDYTTIETMAESIVDDLDLLSKTGADLKQIVTSGPPLANIVDNDGNQPLPINLEDIPDNATFIRVDTPVFSYHS